MSKPLEGMRVLDFSVWRPMPHATQILADLGAEVLKVEPPGGDPMRSYPEIFASVARGKRSVVLDLNDAGDRQRALAFAADAHVICESWRPGVAGRLGVDYETIAAQDPSVIYCSLSGFGQTGPWRETPGHDVNFQAIAGALAPRPGEEPAVPRLPVADLEGGTVCALLICAAWARRLVSGVGERIDVAMADVVAWWVGTGSGTAHEQSATRTFSSPGYGVFRTQDDRWIALGVLGEQRLWEAICDALQLDALRELTFDVRLARADEVNGRIAVALADRTQASALADLERFGAPATPVLTAEEATQHSHFRERAFHVPTDLGLVAALPVAGAEPARSIPAVNAHPEGFAAR